MQAEDIQSRIIRMLETREFEGAGELADLSRCLSVLPGRFQCGKFLHSLANGLSRVGDPPRTVQTLTRLLNNLADYPHADEIGSQIESLIEGLLLVIDNSVYLGDILINHPEFVRDLSREQDLKRPLTTDTLSSQIFGLAPGALLEKQKYLLLKVALHHLFYGFSLKDYTLEISLVAEMITCRIAEYILTNLRARYGNPGNGAELVILGMGKLGGYELNYSSDIDLIFLYTAEGYTSVQKSVSRLSNREFFHRAADEIIKALSCRRPGGWFYRVDTRLRPEGESGPLCPGISSLTRYYLNNAAFWEKQAMIKARIIFGGSRDTTDFINNISTVFFPRHGEKQVLEDIYMMKFRINRELESAGDPLFNVKLGHGGIREIEFLVQALQILNAPRHEGIFEKNTLDALVLLSTLKILSPAETESLRNAYIFLRELEHRVQLVFFRQTHSLPSNEVALGQIAKRMGCKNAKDLVSRYMRVTEKVHSIYSEKIRIPAAHQLELRLLIEDIELERKRSILARYRFQDPMRALKNIYAIYSGTGKSSSFPINRDKFISILPSLLSTISSKPNADMTLARFEMMLNSLSGRGIILELLKDNEFLMFLFTEISSKSAFLVEKFRQNPWLFDTMVHLRDLFSTSVPGFSPPPGLGPVLEDVHPQLVRYVLEQKFRVNLQYILDIHPFQVIGELYSDIADSVLSWIFSNILSEESRNFCVLAAGKWGLRNPGPASDLDLIFLHSNRAKEPQKTAELLIRILGGTTKHGRIFPVDARLRPEGDRGPLSVTPALYGDYLASRGRDWEKLALCCIRSVIGEQSLYEALRETLETFLYESDPVSTESFWKIKSGIEETFKGKDDFKHCPGGLMEIELFLRFLALRAGRTNPRFRFVRGRDILEAASATGAISSGNLETLRETMTFFRHIESASVIAGLQKHHRLPPSLEKSTLIYFALPDRIRYNTSAGTIRQYVRSLCLRARGIIKDVLDTVRENSNGE